MSDFSTVSPVANMSKFVVNTTQIAMIGCGSMGGGMALLFAEVGVHVSLSDPSEEAMDAVIDKADKSGYNGKIHKYTGKEPGSNVSPPCTY
jgi:3-hydroxyacyl-CoA dehydrogenase